MFHNPFTPSRAATAPNEFFGRQSETAALRRSLRQGHIAIHGPIAIGKSSLLEHIRQLEEGFATQPSDTHEIVMSYAAVGNKDIDSVESAAHRLLTQFVQVDERSITRELSFAKLVGVKKNTNEVTNYFAPGRCLDALEDYLLSVFAKAPNAFLLLAIDEVDKCPVAMAQLVRSIVGFCDLRHLHNVRFMLAGVSPYFSRMVKEDNGIQRFFVHAERLGNMSDGEAQELLEAKLTRAVEALNDHGASTQNTAYDPDLPGTISRLAGGHPHLIQLVGYHAVENELADPDGIINARDIAGSLHTICYRDRGHVYEAILRKLSTHGHTETFKDLLRIAHSHCPTLISMDDATSLAENETLDWMVAQNILYSPSGNDYGLVDEFLRIRLLLESDSANEEYERVIIERSLSRTLALPDDTYYSSEAALELDNPDDDVDSDDAALIPILEVRASCEVDERSGTIRVEVHALATDDMNDQIQPEYEEVAVLVRDRNDRVVGRQPLDIGNDVIELRVGSATQIGVCQFKELPPGEYACYAATRARDETTWFYSDPFYVATSRSAKTANMKKSR